MRLAILPIASLAAILVANLLSILSLPGIDSNHPANILFKDLIQISTRLLGIFILLCPIFFPAASQFAFSKRPGYALVMWLFTICSSILWFALSTRNGLIDNTTGEPTTSFFDATYYAVTVFACARCGDLTPSNDVQLLTAGVSIFGCLYFATYVATVGNHIARVKFYVAPICGASLTLLSFVSMRLFNAIDVPNPEFWGRAVFWSGTVGALVLFPFLPTLLPPAFWKEVDGDSAGEVALVKRVAIVFVMWLLLFYFITGGFAGVFQDLRAIQPNPFPEGAPILEWQFSAEVFTTLASVTLWPKPEYRLLVASESIVGLFFLACFASHLLQIYRTRPENGKSTD